MKQFFKIFLASLSALIVFSGLQVVLAIIVIASIAVSGKSDPKDLKVENKSVLQIKLRSGVVDYARFYDEIDIDFLKKGKEADINDIEKALAAAKDDSRIQGVSLQLNVGGPLSISNFNRLYDALKGFKKSGKFIYAYNTNYSQGEYIMSSLADSVFLEPTGMVDMRGIGIESLYLKDMWEKIGVDMLIFRRGKYKSAVEPNMANTMSKENREQLSRIIELYWESFEQKLMENRGLQEQEVDYIVNNVLTTNIEELKKNKLVDVAAYKDEYYDVIRKRLDIKKDKKIKFINLKKYANTIVEEKNAEIKDRVAVLYAEGGIMNGNTGDGPSISESIIKDIRKIGRKKKVKAAVIRVNSPGGDAQLSDRIWHAIKKLGDSIPVVVSMGNYAASGGYYIAMGGHYVFAEPLTLTGSIGVFASIPNLNKVTSDVGINPQYVETHKHANLISVFKKPGKEAMAIVDKSIGEVYDTFLARVAENRDMTTAQVHELAQGRVWVGKDALDKGLVDELGGLDKAIEKTAKLAGIEEYKIVNYPRKKSALDFEEIFKNVSIDYLKSKIIEHSLPKQIVPYIQQLQPSSEVQIQARLPYIYTVNY